MRTYRPGDVVYLQLWWRATGDPGKDWTVFTHLLGPAKPDGNRVWAGRDARPGQGSVPTTAWAPGDLILDEYQLQLPPDAPPGEYRSRWAYTIRPQAVRGPSQRIQAARIACSSARCKCVELGVSGCI